MRQIPRNELALQQGFFDEFFGLFRDSLKSIVRHKLTTAIQAAIILLAIVYVAIFLVPAGAAIWTCIPFIVGA